MSEYRESSQVAGTKDSIPGMSSLSPNAPIEPTHSLSTGMELVHDRSKEEANSQDDDEYGHQFVMKRLKRDLPLPGRWTLLVML
jgi:hypothetical protein